MTSSHPFRILSTLALVAVLVAVLVGMVHLFRGWSSGAPSSGSAVVVSGAIPLPEVSEGRLRRTIGRLSSVESRVTGYPGADEAARYIESEFQRLGMRGVRMESFPVTVPVDRGASLTLVETGEVIPLRCIWPNLVRTPTTPGVRGRLIYAGDGEFTDFDGKEVAGGVVLMDFNSGDRWINAGILGAKAVVFIAPDSTMTGEAEGKFAEAPVAMPRFYVEREAGDRLRKLIESGNRGGASRGGETGKKGRGDVETRGWSHSFSASGGGEDEGVSPSGVGGVEVEVEVQGRMTWEAREGYNVVGTFPGTDPKLKDQTVVLSAYYDGMSVVPALAPAAEMACGIAGLLELGEMLRARPPARTVVFLATSGHCQNMRGIDAFMQRHGRKNKVFTGEMGEPLFPKLFLGLDLSSGNDGVMVWDTREVMGASQFDREKHFFGVSLGRRLAGMAEGIAARMGRRVEDLFANAIASAQSDKGWGKLAPGRPLTIDSEYVLACGTPALSFVTTYDARLRVDSPLDRMEGVRLDNLRTQVVFLGALLDRVLNEADVLDDLVNLDMSDNAWGVEGRVKAYSRYAIVPDIEMGGAVAVLRSRRESKSSKGVRGDYFEVCDERGGFRATRLFREYTMEAHAFVLDPASGDILHAPDRGGSRYPIEVRPRWRGVEKPLIVLFRCVPTTFYETVDPRQLGRLSSITVLDEGNSPPPHYGYFFEEPNLYYREEEPPMGVVFSEPGARIKLTLSTGLFGARFLLVNALPEGGDGEGFLTEQASAFVHTAFTAARDVWRVDDGRIRELRAYGIENARLSALHRQAGELLKAAEGAMGERRWSAFIRAARAAQGAEARAYPDVKGTQNDVIRGVVFFMGVLIPCAFFAERLVFAFPDIRKQIGGFFLFFLGVWVCLSRVHPAFSLASPALILIAFLIISLAGLVLWVTSSRFGAQMRALRTDAAVAHGTDIRRGGAFYAAFMLGISNMRRRRTRTALTLVTVLLLTFTVLSFTSLQFTLRHVRIPWTEGAFRAGALIRDGSWNPLEDSVLDYAQSEFEPVGTVAPRAWYAKATRVLRGGRSAEATAAVGVTPEERGVSGIDSCLIAGRWLEGEAMCVLPDSLAADLGIGATDAGRVTVRIFGRELTVAGILSSERMKALRDLDGEPLAPVDFSVTPEDALDALQTTSQQAAQVSQQVGRAASTVGIHVYKHLEPARVVFLPYRMLRDMGGVGHWLGAATGSLRSVAVRFDEGIDAGRAVENFVSRLELTVFGGVPGQGGRAVPAPQRGRQAKVFVFSALDAASVSGLSSLVVPMVIAALIVLNTMMGAVYERFRDISIYSSVGLAPTHIGLLFVAEACVYAVIGAVGGYLVAQAVGRALLASGLLRGLTLNYSSLSAVMAMGLVMGVVILSTLYPARRASQMAVPDVTRRWQLSDPEGDRWRFEFPFTVAGRDVKGLFAFLTAYFRAYSRYSLGEFYAEGARLDEEETPEGAGYAIRMRMWLAPFDMGVSQEVALRAVPTGRYGIYEIEMTLERVSGAFEAWTRTSRRFLTLLRKQFLIWRTLSDGVREEYAKREEITA